MSKLLTTSEVATRILNMENGEYCLTSAYTKSTEPITVLHKPCNTETHVARAKSFLQENKNRCPKCKVKSNLKNIRLSELDIIQRISAVPNYTYIGGFVNTHTPIMICHTTCGYTYSVTPTTFVDKKSRCPKCANVNRGKHALKINYLSDLLTAINGNEYEWLEPYKNNNKLLHRIKHITCGNKFKIRPNDFQQGYRCPICTLRPFPKESRAIRQIQDFLIQNKIKFEKEVTFDGMIYKRQLFIDICINLQDDAYLLIEYDGIQHFENSNINDLYITQQRDAAKNTFCNSHSNLFLHRISYKDKLITKLTSILKEYSLL